jgi:hypothetical protein
MIAVCSVDVTGTACVGAASSGAYHFPSDANHQPGSPGCWSSGPRGVLGARGGVGAGEGSGAAADADGETGFVVGGGQSAVLNTLSVMTP